MKIIIIIKQQQKQKKKEKRRKKKEKRKWDLYLVQKKRKLVGPVLNLAVIIM
jgi:hypothetical protein